MPSTCTTMIPNYPRDVKCGNWANGHMQICPTHIKTYDRRYPQGWRYYPGDLCKHGTYTGGSGVDWMCGPCEMED